MLPAFRLAADIIRCGGFPFTAIHTFEDAGQGRARYRAVALHRDGADRDKHAEMGFEEGCGICPEQPGEVAAALRATA
jgi:hypothetical protein